MANLLQETLDSLAQALDNAEVDFRVIHTQDARRAYQGNKKRAAAMLALRVYVAELQINAAERKAKRKAGK